LYKEKVSDGKADNSFLTGGRKTMHEECKSICAKCKNKECDSAEVKICLICNKLTGIGF